MSGQPAARVGDNIACFVPQATPAALPHAPPPGLPIIPPGAPTVYIGGSFAARMGDASICVAPVPTPNPIARGAFPVPIEKMAAARMTDSGTHPGSVISPPCCPTVYIGLAGTTGNPRLGTQACQNMAAGRNPPPGSTDSTGKPLGANSTGQSYNNCGIESSRQIINSAGGNVTQEGLFNQALTAGNTTVPAIGSTQGGGVVTAQNQMYYGGGTTSQGQVAILNANNVPATRIAPLSAAGVQVSQYETALSQGRGIIANGDVSGLPGWGGQTGPHAVTVTGLEYDDAGNITHVNYNDTGLGYCGLRATKAEFDTFLGNGAASSAAGGFAPSGSVVTSNPIW